MNIVAKAIQLKFVLIRAGATEIDCCGRILGALNLPLSDSGQIEVDLTVEELADWKFACIYSSAGLAAQQTAQQLAKKTRSKFRADQRLSNLNCGLWHGMTIEELRDNQPTLFRQWREHPERICPPEGETIDDVRSRAVSFLGRVRRKHKTGLIGIVTPDPLLSIIRSELVPNSVTAQKIDPTRCGDWRMVETL
jgi:broad specificity phosphatase PhoE